MGNFFNSSKAKIIDRVFMFEQSKWNYCLKIFSEKPQTIFIGWFQETIDELESNFRRSISLPVTILNARTVNKQQVDEASIIFIEHQPRKSKEDKFFKELGLSEIIVLSALDEPLLNAFGGEKLVDMMQKLGMKEDEIIEHKLVTQSITNAQEKIEKKVMLEQTARSQAEWIERNFK